MMHGNGCQHWQDCFTCPLPACIYDEHKSNFVQTYRRRLAAARAAQLLDAGATMPAVATALGVSERTVARYLAERRRQPVAC